MPSRVTFIVQVQKKPRSMQPAEQNPRGGEGAWNAVPSAPGYPATMRRQQETCGAVSVLGCWVRFVKVIGILRALVSRRSTC